MSPVVGVTDTVSACPPAVYPLAVTSLADVYAAVVASKDALAVYKAILNVPVLKLNVPFIRPVLNALVAVCAIDIYHNTF